MKFKLKNNKLLLNKIIKNNTYINQNILSNHINISTGNRLSGKNYLTDRAVYSSQNPNGNFVRSTSCWINGVTNISCFSPAQLSGSNWFQKGGTLITKKHVLFAAHYLPTIINGGTPIIFVDENNNKVTRNIIQYAVDGTDIAIALLDSEVSDNIKIAKVLPKNFDDYFNTSIYNDVKNIFTTNPGFNNVPYLYAIGLDQQEKAILKIFTGTRLLSAGASSSLDPNYFVYQYATIVDIEGDYEGLQPNSSQFQNWSEPIVVGDSGNPAFIIIDNELVLLCSWLTNSGGPFVTNRYDQINTLIESLSPGSGYVLSSVDLAAVYSKYS